MGFAFMLLRCQLLDNYLDNYQKNNMFKWNVNPEVYYVGTHEKAPY